MSFAEPDNVRLAHQRLAAAEQEEIASERVGLIDDIIHFLICEIQLVAVFGCPAASAVEVAGRGGIHQNRPRNVAVVFFLILTLSAEAE